MNHDSAARETTGPDDFHVGSGALSPHQPSISNQASSSGRLGFELWFPPLRVLPDPAICRAKPAGFGDYADCLVENPFSCPHALGFGSGFYCQHPQRKEISLHTLAQTLGREQGIAQPCHTGGLTKGGEATTA